MAFPISPAGTILMPGPGGTIVRTLKGFPPAQFKLITPDGRAAQPLQEYFNSLDAMLRQAQAIALATPNNANAKAAGVPLGGLYTSTADPAIVYIRTI